MAKILFTAFMADARNKVAGTVFSKNRYGAYTRTKVTPVNPQSVAQQLRRSQFGARSAAWRSLTEAQRISWIDAAPSFPIFDIFGASKILSGQALYNRLNLNLTLAGQANITTAPAAGAVGAITTFPIISDVSLGQVLTGTTTPVVVPAGNTLVFFATPQYGAGISFVKNKYRFTGTVAAGGSIEDTNIPGYVALFGVPILGQKVSVKAFCINNTTGQAGVPISDTTVTIA